MTKRLFYEIQDLLLEKHNIEFEYARHWMNPSKGLPEGGFMLVASCKRYSDVQKIREGAEPITFTIRLPLEEEAVKRVIATYLETLDWPVAGHISDERIIQGISRAAKAIADAAHKQISQEIHKRFHDEIKELLLKNPINTDQLLYKTAI